MKSEVKFIGVINTVGGSVAACDDVFIGSKGSQKQGLVKLAGLPSFPFSAVKRYSKRQAFQAAVAGVYTFTPGITTPISDFTLGFQWTGFLPKDPKAERQTGKLLCSVSANETMTNEQFCARIVATAQGNTAFSQLYTAAHTVGAGNADVVTFTENVLNTPDRNIHFAELYCGEKLSSMTFAKTTATVAQYSYTGQNILDMIANEFGDSQYTIKGGAINAAHLYSTFTITVLERDLSAPFDYSVNKPVVYQIFVDEATNVTYFESKLNAVFAIDAGTFAPFTGGIAATLTIADEKFTVAAATDLPAEDDEVVVTSLTTTTGPTVGTTYYAKGVDTAAKTFQISATKGGAAVNLATGDGSATYLNGAWGGDAAADVLLATPVND